MPFKRFFAVLFAVMFLMPVSASAAVTLSAAGQAQLSQLGAQLINILSQIMQAQALGTAYAQSPAFQAQAGAWTSQLVQIQQQLVVLISTNAQTTPTYSTTPTYPTSSTNSSCPNLLRTLDLGSQGSDVADLQAFLARDPYAKFTGSVSGYYDASTAIAVQRFQTYYNIVSYGSPETTGFGKAGPTTRTSILAVCQSQLYSAPVPPIITTTNPTPVYTTPTPPVTTVQTAYSTAELSLIPQLTGQSGGPTSVTFKVNMQPNSACTSSAFLLSFGDGQQQSLSSNPSCGNQIQQVPHVYPTTGIYSATLTSGSFQATLQVNLQPANNSLSLSAAADQSVSYGSVITATYNPGTTCANGAYTLNFADNSTQSLSFANGCSAQTQTINHVFPGTGPYLITASDANGRTVTTNFTGAAVASAGAGDPRQVLLVHGDGANNSNTFVDSSPKAHALSGFGGARIDTASPKVGSGSIRFTGSSYISTPDSEDFNFGSGAFTIDFWLQPLSFPAAQQQAAVFMQASASAADTSLGGAGLEFFGNQLYFVGRIGGVTYHPFYSNTIHTVALTVGTWYHVALVRSGNALNLYLNGTSTDAMVVTGSANASSNDLTFGRYGEFDGNYFNGKIDEINIAKGVARWTGHFNPETRQ